MAPIKLKEVIVFSSQDPVQKADNLLKLDSQWKRWLCAADDRTGSMEAEFQLDKAAKIGYVDIGNYGSAFVEILVRKSSWSSSSYRTLIPATMFMSPMESKSGQNKCAVKMFTKAALSEDALKEEWDRIKVKCSQPYRKDTQFGLAFIRLRSLEEPKEERQSVSPGPTMSKLLSKSESSPATSKPKGRAVLSPSWKTNSSFQRQITALNNAENKYSDGDLKSRLLKMAATTETGSDKKESLSRSAKMVLTSSNGKHPKTPKTQSDTQRGKTQSPPSANNLKKAGFVGPQNRDKVPSTSHERRNSDAENCPMTSPPVKTNYSNNYLANTSSTPKRPPEPKRQVYGQKISPAFDTAQRKNLQETLVPRQPTKRQSDTNFQTSPSKMKNPSPQRSFKDSVNFFLVSLGPHLLDSKLSDIRPAFETKMGRKLTKEERKILKELAVERVDVLLKNGSFPTAERPNRQLKPKPTAPKPKPTASSSLSVPVSSPSPSTDVMAMEFRNCPKCYLKFTASQIIGHILSCQGIQSARGVGISTASSPENYSKSSPTPGFGRGGSVKRGRGRGLGGGNGKQGRGGRAAALPRSPDVATYSASPHMPSYQHEGAVAKQKQKGRTAVSSARNVPASVTNNPVSCNSPPKPDPPQEGALTILQCNKASTSSPANNTHMYLSSNSTPNLANNSEHDQDVVECAPCPICFDNFPMEFLEMHADLCLERNTILQEMSNSVLLMCSVSMVHDLTDLSKIEPNGS